MSHGIFEKVMVMDSPLISIIMSVRNGSDTIKETIESVIAQTYKNWELFIRDNCSTDGTIDIIKSFNDSRIKIILNDNDKGSFFNHLLNIQSAQGEYIKQMDDDSYIYPDCLEKQARVLMENANFAMVSCDTEYRTKKGKIIAVKIPFKNDIVTRNDYIKYTLATGRGSVQEGNQTLCRIAAYRFAYDRMMAIGFNSGLVNMYSAYFFGTAAVLAKGDMYIIRETLSFGLIEADSHSLEFNQAKLQPSWIKLLRLDGCKINLFLYIRARIMIIVRSAARRFAFWLLGRKQH
jgi:glycosyltransferase involved in cell wall biosynthesis